MIDSKSYHQKRSFKDISTKNSLHHLQHLIDIRPVVNSGSASKMSARSRSGKKEIMNVQSMSSSTASPFKMNMKRRNEVERQICIENQKLLVKLHEIMDQRVPPSMLQIDGQKRFRSTTASSHAMRQMFQQVSLPTESTVSDEAHAKLIMNRPKQLGNSRHFIVQEEDSPGKRVSQSMINRRQREKDSIYQENRQIAKKIAQCKPQVGNFFEWQQHFIDFKRNGSICRSSTLQKGVSMNSEKYSNGGGTSTSGGRSLVSSRLQEQSLDNQISRSSTIRGGDQRRMSNNSLDLNATGGVRIPAAAAGRQQQSQLAMSQTLRQGGNQRKISQNCLKDWRSPLLMNATLKGGDVDLTTIEQRADTSRKGFKSFRATTTSFEQQQQQQEQAQNGNSPLNVQKEISYSKRVWMRKKQVGRGGRAKNANRLSFDGLEVSLENNKSTHTPTTKTQSASSGNLKPQQQQQQQQKEIKEQNPGTEQEVLNYDEAIKKVQEKYIDIADLKNGANQTTPQAGSSQK